MKKARLLLAATVLTLSAGAFWLAPTGDANALPANETYRLYYSNSAKTNVVGEQEIMSCWGYSGRMVWGVKTSYYRLFQGGSCL